MGAESAGPTDQYPRCGLGAGSSIIPVFFGASGSFGVTILIACSENALYSFAAASAAAAAAVAACEASSADNFRVSASFCFAAAIAFWLSENACTQFLNVSSVRTNAFASAIAIFFDASGIAGFAQLCLASGATTAAAVGAGVVCAKTAVENAAAAKLIE